MTSLSLKFLFRNRLTLLTTILLTAATILLSISSCLFYSTKETAESVTGMFHTIPLVDLSAYIKSDYLIDEEAYGRLADAFITNPYLSRDDRRLYTGYGTNIKHSRSQRKLIRSAFGDYYDVTGDDGNMFWDQQYMELVLECTLLRKLLKTEGGSYWAGEEENRREVFYYPTYLYEFQIDSILAQTDFMSPVEGLTEQKVYVQFEEKFDPTGLEVGDRCLLKGVGDATVSVCFSDPSGEDYWILADGRIISERDFFSTPIEEREEKYNMHLKTLELRGHSSFLLVSSGLTKDEYISLPRKKALDVSSREAFLQSSGLGAEEGERWFHIIQNCREAVNSLSVISTENSRNILTFTSKATQIIAGRHILPGDTEPVCIISGELAEINNLSVGDTLPLRLLRAEVEAEPVIDFNKKGKKWYLKADCEACPGLLKISYRIVGIYRSMEWNDNVYADYFSPNTVFVSVAATPEIERSPRMQTLWEDIFWWCTKEESEAQYMMSIPQVLWGYYLTESDQAQAFMDSLPEEVRRNIQLLDEGYEHIQPQLEALREQMKGIVLLTLGAWVLVAALFIFLCLFRGQSAMGTLRSLGAGIGYTFRRWLLLCLCLWLVSAGIGGVLSGVLYDKIEQKVFEAASYGEAYNQAFSDLGSAAEQGYNPYEGTQGHSGESAETVYRQVKDTLHIGRVLPLTILAQGGVFLLLCAVTLACLTRRKVPKLLRSV